MEIYQIVILVVAAILAMLYFIDRFTGHKLINYVIQWRPVLVALTATVSAIAKVLPSSYFTTVAIVLQAAADATVTAEDLWKLGELEKADRNEYAIGLVTRTLELAGIEVTDQVKQIVDGCIAIVCMLMPHESDR